ncbi:MAG: ABC transporter substrate-binding protein [Galactobacillus timonensis]|jgi:raffinose/stachyose/melibiose transport system substrate-binding protein|uniref:ABC transporter substrate-binding protein n=1 Tax=Galactobacillus timonensis TaxID=2041840 RepID=UPI0023F3EDFE|nr:ABC transporter substrate-binding protein [Galactobacillus timonensis]MCI6754401.1 ABC transporter substrate-binding protein [Galactobacillus timonensis]MDD6599021.1 ABC transporter substrate-binding protein [Galactobacillus timonensis]MDY6282531.1 ABC transporter substrate-binding protein [Erysipelotrichaceae bacterium]
MNSKKILAFAMSAAMLAGCGSSASGSAAASTSAAAGTAAAASGTGRVYYLNFKPEADEYWQDLAKEYTKETGVPVTVLTAASGEYESTLKSEMAKSEAPTMFQVNGPVGLASWKDYCYDLSGSKLEGELSNSAYELKDGDKVAGIAYVTEAYGLITNKALLEKAGYTVDDIKSFDDLKKVAEDITARKDELGFSAFTSAGMDSSSDWRFKTHLANLPIYYEYKDAGVDNLDELKGTYLDNYRAIWDLYINNSTIDPSQLSTATGDQAESEFVNQEAVFFQNGTWEYDAVKAIGDDNLAYLPIYFGVDDANEGLCMGTENYWCVNSQASPEDIQATLDFMYWCVTSDAGVNAMTSGDKMGFNIPFKSNPESTNVLFNLANANTGTPVSWNFTTMPSEEWKNTLGQALTVYAADQTDANWEQVRSAFVDNWATEKQLAASNG